MLFCASFCPLLPVLFLLACVHTTAPRLTVLPPTLWLHCSAMLGSPVDPSLEVHSELFCSPREEASALGFGCYCCDRIPEKDRGTKACLCSLFQRFPICGCWVSCSVPGVRQLASVMTEAAHLRQQGSLVAREVHLSKAASSDCPPQLDTTS